MKRWYCRGLACLLSLVMGTNYWLLDGIPVEHVSELI